MLPILRIGRKTTSIATASLFAVACLCCAVPALAQQATLGTPRAVHDPELPSQGPEPLPPPLDAGPANGLPAGSEQVMPIDLVMALRLAGTNNLDVSRARELVNQSRIQFDRAKLLLLPNLGMGSTYYKHEGNIAKTEGNIIKANKDSLFAGGGPSANISFADAIFAPLVAKQAANASQAGSRRVHNDTLLAVAEAYFAVLRARRKLARVEIALEYLTSEQPSPLRAGSKGLLPVVDAMQKAGVAEALKAEVYRVETEVLRRQEERVAAQQEFRVAVAELARLLRLDPATPLWPMEDFRVALEWSAPWASQPLEEQVRVALSNRPEMAENQYLIQAAVERVRDAKFRPLLPNLIFNYAWGGFGGGPDPNAKGGGFQESGSIAHFNTRTDFDVSLVWKLQSLGLGNYAEVREQQSLVRQATLRQLQVRDQVITQVVQTNEQIKGWRERITITRAALFDKSGKPAGPVFEAIRQNFTRIREQPKTRPLEVLDSIRSLSDFLDSYGQALTDYERSRFRLMIALGLEPAAILGAIATGPECITPK